MSPRAIPVLGCALAAVGLLGLLYVPAGLAAGNTLYVKTSGNDSAPCSDADPCRTINHAVSVAEAGDTIQLGPGTFSEDHFVRIAKNLTITGLRYAGVRVTRPSGSGGPVFVIELGANVTLSGMSISGANDVTAGISRAGISSAGGIYNQGSLTLERVLIFGNRAEDAGGIFNGGSLTMRNVEINRNFGHVGLRNWGTADVVDSAIVGTRGGSPYEGDGVDNAGTLTMNRGLIAGNEGGGVDAWSPTLHPTTSLSNVTISGNSRGGVVGRGEMTLTHVTIAANKDGHQAGLRVVTGSASLRNSIVATNSGPQCSVEPDLGATLDVSYSLLGDDSCASGSPTPDNLIGVDPKLSGLTYKGARIRAMPVRARLRPGSPAIDSAGDEFCTATDLLGRPRPIDGDGDGVARCDMGAFEYARGITRPIDFIRGPLG